MDKFVNLHGHSEYSALDGFTTITRLVSRVKEIEQPAIALTEHGNMNGHYKFYNACVKEGIKPILGIEAYITPEYEKYPPPHHITLLAKNNEGWKNLLKLYRISNENFYYKPRISFQDLFDRKNGIICLSGCPSGIASKHIRQNNVQHAKGLLQKFHAEFKDDFYIELMDHNLDFQKEINHNLRELSKELGIKRVGTNDYHYASKSDAKYQDYLTIDSLKTTIHDTERRIGLTESEFYIKKRSEMFLNDDELDTTLEIADKCNVDLSTKGFLLPHIEDQEGKITELINAGLTKYNLWDNVEYMSRLREEFKIIKEADLTGYFLVVQDYIDFARKQGILVGPGRGSVGGSILAYLIGIHTVDPIKHKLLFSRFYNAGRKGSLPDVDTDFPEKRIGEVREYVRQKYGHEKVSHIGTYTYLKDKSALKLVCRVLGVDFGIANRYSMIVEDKNRTEDLKTKDENFRNIVEISEHFKGVATHSSIHAAGMIISPVDLDEIIPLRINDKNGLFVSSWDMHDVEDVGLVKFDFLSLSTLDVIEDTLKLINITIDDIPTDDAETFHAISNKSNTGIFQLSSDGISQIANRMKVESIDDIAVVVALYRPGPINSGLHEKYIKRKNGLETVEYAHPLLATVLDDTYGIFVYQEQIIQTVMVLAGFSETEADLLRKAIGKKLPELMEEQKSKFLDGCKKNNVDVKVASKLWEEIQEFAEYSFNRAHSVEYGYITYYTAYLKTHYPAEFMSALLNNNYSNNAKLSVYLKECENMMIEVTPPSIMNGGYDFTAKDGKIIFGLKGISGIGEKTAKAIYEQKYTSFEDFCIKATPGSDTIVAMAEAGVFDEFQYNRNQIIQSANNISKAMKEKKKVTNKRARMLFDVKPNFNISNIEELPNSILAQKEYNRLNVHLVYNPLRGINLDTPDVLEGAIFIEAYIVKVNEHVTKKKATMGMLILETGLGQIEAVVFPRKYSEVTHILRPGTFIAINGIVNEGKIHIKECWRKQDVIY